MKISSFLLLVVAAFVLGFVSHVHAHSVWLEDTPDGKLVLRFGEPGEEFEKSPGHLDELDYPVIWTPGADGKPSPFKVEKKSDFYAILGAAPGNVALADTGYAVLAAKDKPGRKPFFYARWHVAGAAAAPAMNFDIVPTVEPGTVRVYFRGKPLPEVKITLRPPKGADKELVADKDGIARFETTGPGLYLMTCAHQREPVPGFAGGLSYEMVSHNCSLAWRQP